jgi:hypothetical protein
MFQEAEMSIKETFKYGHLTNLPLKDGRSYMKMRLSQSQRRVNSTQSTVFTLRENSMLFQL